MRATVPSQKSKWIEKNQNTMKKSGFKLITRNKNATSEKTIDKLVMAFGEIDSHAKKSDVGFAE